jgi:hypothetical protein
MEKSNNFSFIAYVFVAAVKLLPSCFLPMREGNTQTDGKVI